MKTRYAMPVLFFVLRALVLFILLGFLWHANPTSAATLKIGLMDEPKTLNPFAAKDAWSAKVLLERRY